MTPEQAKTLATHQLVALIERGKYVDICKAEWRRRWALNYPLYKTISGIKRYGE